MYIRYQSEASDTHWLSQRGRGGKRDELRHLRLSLWIRINNRMSRCTAIISSPPATKAQQTWCWSKAADKSSMAFWRFYQQHTDWTECWFVQQSSCSLKGTHPSSCCISSHNILCIWWDNVQNVSLLPTACLFFMTVSCAFAWDPIKYTVIWIHSATICMKLLL